MADEQLVEAVYAVYAKKDIEEKLRTPGQLYIASSNTGSHLGTCSAFRCKPKKCRQECKKSCPVVKIGERCYPSCVFDVCLFELRESDTVSSACTKPMLLCREAMH